MNIHDKINDLIISKKVYIYLASLLIIGIFFMIFSKNPSGKDNYNATSTTVDTSTDVFKNQSSIETKLKSILSKAEGVGEIEIIINYISPSEESYSTETEFQSDEYPFVETENKNNSVSTKGSQEINGVLIVIQGGDDERTVYNIKEAVSGFLGIPIHKVRILNMK